MKITDQEGGEMSDRYTVETIDGMHACGHQHRTAEAADRCLRRSRRDNPCRYYNAVVLKNGQRANGIGLWADGEVCGNFPR